MLVTGHLTRNQDLRRHDPHPSHPGVSVSQSYVTNILGGWNLDALSMV